jgi:hypothetical protein
MGRSFTRYNLTIESMLLSCKTIIVPSFTDVVADTSDRERGPGGLVGVPLRAVASAY